MTNAKVIPASEVEVGMEILLLNAFVKVTDIANEGKTFSILYVLDSFQEEAEEYTFFEYELVTVKQPELDIDAAVKRRLSIGTGIPVENIKQIFLIVDGSIYCDDENCDGHEIKSMDAEDFIKEVLESVPLCTDVSM